MYYMFKQINDYDNDYVVRPFQIIQGIYAASRFYFNSQGRLVPETCLPLDGTNYITSGRV